MMNVLVLCTDTFRADYLGCYGNTWVETPHLDRLASEGVLLTDFYGEGLPTIPSRRVFYTGRRIFPMTYRPQKSDPVQLPGWHPLYDEDITLAEWLSKRGYTTGLVGDLYHIMKPGKNFHRGFHSWQWIRGQEIDPLVPTPHCDLDVSRHVRPEEPPDSGTRRRTAQYLNNRAWWKSEADHYAAQVMRAAADWISTHGHKKPWMLWVESFDPHEPWDAPQSYVEKYCPNYDGLALTWAPAFTKDCSEEEFAWIRANYAGECSHVDTWCGYVLDTLERKGLKDDTIVVFTSDHGTMMGEQGQIHKGQDRVRIQVARSPLILRHPDNAYAGKKVSGLVQQQDLMPTLLRLLGEPVPERCNGEDFWPVVTGERQGGLRNIIITSFGWYAGVRTKKWNYQTAWARPGNRAMRLPELYDCPNDPDELVNVIDRYPEVARELQGHLEEAMKGHAESGGKVEGTDTPAAIPGLRW